MFLFSQFDQAGMPVAVTVAVVSQIEAAANIVFMLSCRPNESLQVQASVLPCHYRYSFCHNV